MCRRMRRLDSHGPGKECLQNVMCVSIALALSLSHSLTHSLSLSLCFSSLRSNLEFFTLQHKPLRDMDRAHLYPALYNPADYETTYKDQPWMTTRKYTAVLRISRGTSGGARGVAPQDAMSEADSEGSGGLGTPEEEPEPDALTADAVTYEEALRQFYAQGGKAAPGTPLQYRCVCCEVALRRSAVVVRMLCLWMSVVVCEDALLCASCFEVHARSAMVFRFICAECQAGCGG